MKTNRVLACAVLVAAAQPLAAQISTDVTDKAQAAAFAISSTPVGALPWLVTPHSLGTAKGTGLRFQAGNIDEAGDFSRRIVLGGIDFPVGRSTIGISAGYLDFACGNDAAGPGIEIDCKGGLMAGARAGTSLVSAPVGTGSTTSFLVGIDGSVGFGTGDVLELSFDDGFGNQGTGKFEGTSMALGLSLPVALVARGAGVTVAPHITPGVGYGRLTAKVSASGSGFTDSSEDSESGARFMLGGGAAILFTNSGLGLHLGFQKVFVKDGEATLALGLSYTMR